MDQTRLPDEAVWNDRALADDVVTDIQRLAVRGAPAIGVAGAYGLVLAARTILQDDPAVSTAEFRRRLGSEARRVAEARPTAVNLSMAVERSLAHLDAQEASATDGAVRTLYAAAAELEDYERQACAAIGEHGAALLRERPRVLTHCNAGALVTPGIGTALAPLYVLHAEGVALQVWVDETRPLLQGLRLTAYELTEAGIANRVLVEGAAAGLMRAGLVDAVIVGADRVCANGDVANKVGTYGLAVAARHHGIPFYVAAPLTTLDPDAPSGDAVPIEERPTDGMRYLQPGLAPRGLSTYAPAFDLTPADLVTALITEHGSIEAPDTERLAPLVSRSAALRRGARIGG